MPSVLTWIDSTRGTFSGGPMKSAVLCALIVLNAVLLLSFWNRVMGDNTAMAQAPRARPGDYLMIPTEIQGSTNGVVMVVNQTDSTMSAFSYDDANNRFDSMPK